MSKVPKGVPTKRSSSFSQCPSKNTARPLPFKQIANQNQSCKTEESYRRPSSHGLYTEPNYFEPSTSTAYLLEKETNLSLCLEIERLKAINAQLKTENKALTNKLIENTGLQQKIGQLESQNKQLLKDLARKEEILLYSSQERTPSRTNTSSKSPVKPSYADIVAQNKNLIDEVEWLKDQLDTVIKEKSAAEAKGYMSQKFEAQLEEANEQMGLLKQELVRKNYEVEELSDRVQRLKAERDLLQARPQDDNGKYMDSVRDQIRDFEKRKGIRQINLIEGDKSPVSASQSRELSSLRQDLLNTQEKLQLTLRRAEIAENEADVLRSSVAKKDLEIEGLRRKMADMDINKEEEIKIKLEKEIKAKSNEAIKQMLQEKLHYEEKIEHLNQKIEDLKSENEKLKTHSEEEWIQMETEIKKLKEGSQDIENDIVRETEGRLQSLEKRYQSEVKTIHQRYCETEKALEECQEQLEKAKRKISIYERRAEENEYNEGEGSRDMSKQLVELKQANAELNEAKIRLEEENELLINKAVSYKEKLVDAEVKMGYAVKDAEKFRTLYTDIAKQLEAERCQKGAMIKERVRKENLEREFGELKDKEIDPRDSKLNSERRQYESQIRQLKAMKESAQEEIENLYELLKQRKQECEFYIQENQQLWDENQRLKGDVHSGSRRYSSELMQSEKKNERCKQDVEVLNKRLEEINVELCQKVDEMEY